MTKIIIIMLIALTFEAVGVILLSKGLKEIGEMGEVKPAAIIALIKKGITNQSILLGVFFEALFFAGLLIMMSRADVSFVWPLTSLSFVFTTIAARYYLGEQVTLTRWSGVILICIGAGLITWTEKQKRQTPPAAPVIETPASL